MAENDLEELHAVVERITFNNSLTGFVIAKVKEKRKKELSTILGTLPNLQPGQSVYCQGKWEMKPPHGLQFNVHSCQTALPQNCSGIQKYLESGMIKGIGPVYAQKIVDQFKEKTLDIIDSDPQRLHQVPGIGKKRVQTIIENWNTQKAIRDVIIFLQRYQISPAYAQKIYKRYGDQAIETVTKNPYQLSQDIFGIGFKMADTIAQNLGLEAQAPQRLEAGILYTLREAATGGHCCLPKEELLPKTAQLLNVPAQLLDDCLQSLQEKDEIKIQTLVQDSETQLGAQDFIWSKALFIAEKGIVKELQRIKYEPSTLRRFEGEKAAKWVQKSLDIELAPAQEQALIDASLSQNKIHIITGGPGTGKSTITKAICHLLKQLPARLLLAAPTGRAAKRLSEASGFPASTIHQLLEFDFRTMGFRRRKDNPLECDALIIDEASMVDAQLFYSLLKAIPSSSKLILVGDIDQLPSVGPGSVLQDLIESHTIACTRLTEIFRQAAHSKIIQAAHSVNRSQTPQGPYHADDDFFFLEMENPEKILQTILGLVCQRLPQKFNFDPFLDIQVLAPMKKGYIGIDNLNFQLQKQLHMGKASQQIGNRNFYLGDKLMQLRNNYKKEIYNGDIGLVTQIDPDEKTLTLQLPDQREILYDFCDIDELQHAYAVSVHKYQGSECPCIIMPIHSSHTILLEKNLLYTALTRGKKLVVLLGSPKALNLAVHQTSSLRRYTGLRQALLGAQTPAYLK